MTDLNTAVALVEQSFNVAASSRPHMSFAAVDKRNIIETSFAWILPWNDRRFLAGDLRFQLVGHSPRVVLKENGQVMELPPLTASERAKWKSKELHGSIEDRIANLAEKLGVRTDMGSVENPT